MNTSSLGRTTAAGVCALALATIGSVPLWGQATVAPTTAPDDDAIVLSPFEVSSSSDTGYTASTSLSGTRVATPIANLPMTVNVMTKDFLQDIGVEDLQDAVRYTVKGQFLGIPKRMTITTADGSQVAEVKAKAFSFVKDKMTLTMADGSTWQIEGSLLEKNYSIASEGQPIAQITQKWMTVRDKYTADYLSSLDPGLVMAVVWAIDRWVERD